MSALLSRARGLLRRYRIDRRLPPEVSDLLLSTARLRRDDMARRGRAASRPVLGSSGPDDDVVRLGDRRVVAGESLQESLSDSGHEQAGRLVDALVAAELEVWLVARRDDGLEFGIDVCHRDAALKILAERLGAVGVYLDWEDGTRSGIVALSEAQHSRQARRSRRWNIFTAYEWGERAIGRSAGARVTFWDVGTSGQREMIGTRGQQRFHVDVPVETVHVDGHEYPGVATFPVGRMLEEFMGDIDVVYTWVDGADPVWRSDFEFWARQHRGLLPETAFDAARFRSRDELRYSLRSVWAYCGWVRNIYIVTSGQVPDWLIEDDRVRVVPHGAILPASVLPTFNSHAIESALHRIDGLAERFIYLNDDVFVGRPRRPEDFFTSNGLPRVFQSEARVHGVEHADSLAVDTAAMRARSILEASFGRVAAFKPLHAPFALRRSLLAEIAEEFSEVVQRTQASRFRSPSDLSVASSFASHYALGSERAILGDIHCEYVHVESDRLGWALDRIALGSDVDTFCINETHDDGGDHTEREDRLAAFFEQQFPVAAPWEKKR